MRRLHAALLACAAAVALAACGPSAERPIPRGSVVLVVGDSITAGYGVDPGEAWPARLAAATGWRVVAAGVSGDVTAAARARLEPLLEEHAPALVVLELGGNDLLRRTPPKEIAAHLDAMIVAVQARGARVALMAAPQPSAIGALAGLSAAPLYREVAARRRAALIEKALPAVLSDDKLKLDAIHPNAAGHAALARKALEEMRVAGLAPE